MTNRLVNVFPIILLGVACLQSFADEPVFPPAPSKGVEERMEAIDTYRLIERDMRFHAVAREPGDINGNTNVPCFQPPASETENRHALIWPEDRDPLDVLLRRTRALADDLAGMQEKRTKDEAVAFGKLVAKTVRCGQPDSLGAYSGDRGGATP